MEKVILYSMYNTILKKGLQKIIHESLQNEPVSSEIVHSAPKEIVLYHVKKINAGIVVLDDYRGAEKTSKLLSMLLDYQPALIILLIAQSDLKSYENFSQHKELHFFGMASTLNEMQVKIAELLRA